MMLELLVLVIIVAALSLAVYHIAQFSTKETPFEEALAEQRQKRSLDIVSVKTEKILKKTKLKKVKPRKDEITAASAAKDNIVPVHRPTTTKGKDNTTTVQGLPLKEKNSPDMTLQKRGATSGSIQHPQKTKPPVIINPVENVQKTALEKKEKKAKEEKAEEKEEKKWKREESKSIKSYENGSDERDSRKSKKDEKAKKDSANEEKKGSKDKEKINKQEVKDGKEKAKKEDKEERKGKKEETKIEKKGKKIENKDEKKEQETKKTKKEEAKEEKETQDPGKKGGKSPGGTIPHPAGTVERTINKKNNEPVAPKNSPGGGSTPKTAPSPKKVAHSTKESKHKNNEESQKMEKVKVTESALRPLEQTTKAQLQHEPAPVGGGSPQGKKRKERDERKDREERKRLISLSDDVVSRLMPIIQRAQLSGGEVQTLIEALLNKQQVAGDAGEGEWVAKGRVDPVIQLRRQLEDSEARLREQTDAHETLSAKIVDLRSELNSERGRSSLLKKKLESSGAQWQQRLDAAATTHKELMAAKLAELRATLNQEYQLKLTQHQQNVSSDHEGKLKELRTSLADLEVQLQKAKSVQQESEAQCQQMQTALAEAQQQLQASSQEREELMATCQQYQQHLASMKEQSDQQEAAINSRLYEVQQKATASENAHSQAMMQLSQLANEKEIIQQQLASLDGVREMLSQSQVALKNITLEKTDLENRLLQVERSKTDLENRLHQSETEKADSENRLHQSEKDRKELDIRLTQMEKELTGFRELVKNQKTEIECLKEEKESLASQSVRPAAEGRENGDVHDDRREQQSFEHIHEEQISALTKEISRLKEESLHQRRKNEEERLEIEKSTKSVLLRIYPSLKSVEHLEHGAFLQEVETASAAVKAQPSHVVEKVVEKIVEKVVPDPKLCKQVDELAKENSDLHKKMESLQSENSQLESRVKELNVEKMSLENNMRSSLIDDEDRRSLIAKLQLENKELTEKITNYQDILANTESLLKTLQKSVESEESTWHEKLLQKEELVRQLTADKKNLTLQVSEIQSSLDKVKQAEEAAAQLCDLQFAYNCMEKSLPSILSQMESQLNVLKEKLSKEEEEKEQIQEQLNKAQEQLKAANSVQVSTNGPANGVDDHEHEVGQTETVSLVSSEGQGTPAVGASKKKKLKKNFLFKFMRKSTHTEAGSSVVSE